MRRLVLLCTGLLVAACSSGSDIEVTLQAPTLTTIDPFSEVGAERVRITVLGDSVGEFAAVTGGLDLRSATLSGFAGIPTEIRVEIFDGQANVLGLGRRRIAEDEQGPYLVVVRRNLAYAILDSVVLPDPDMPDDRTLDQTFHAEELHVIDMFSGARVAQVALPGTMARGRSITNWGGQAVLVIYDDSVGRHLGKLDTGSHEWTSVMLPSARDRVLATADSAIGLLVGGGRLTPVDLSSLTLQEDLSDDSGAPLSVSGGIVDGVMAANGRTALVVTNSGTGLARVDLDFLLAEALDVTPNPSGVGLGKDGRSAFVSSASERLVFSVDLETGFDEERTQFLRPVQFSAFAEATEAFVGIESVAGSGRGRVLVSDTINKASLDEDTEVGTLLFPTAVATDGFGRRGLVVARGGPGSDPGFTLFEVLPDIVRGPRSNGFFFPLPIGTTLSYPPQTVVFPGKGDQLVRFPPIDVAVVFGR